MSTTVDLSPGSEGKQLFDAWKEVFEKYYREKISTVARKYPEDQDWLIIDYSDIEIVDLDLADALTDPELGPPSEEVLEIAARAINQVEIPIETDLAGIEPRVIGLPNDLVYHPEDLRAEHGGSYVGIEANLRKVTQPMDYPEEIMFGCQGDACTAQQLVPQSGTEIQKPSYCEFCERQTEWDRVPGEGNWTDMSKVQLTQGIDQTKSNQGASLTGEVKGSLVEGYGTELYARAGEDVIAYGILKRRPLEGRGTSDILHDTYLDVKAIDFESAKKEVDIDAHIDRIKEEASRSDAVNRFTQSIAPEIHMTDRWERAMYLGTAYLFGGYRIDTDDGPMYRGDIHGAIFGDPGTAKSAFTRNLERISPNNERRSATGLSSDVGLTVAAVKDDFGEGQFTLEPGVLVRANGGHAIIDEIDKGPDDLSKINDALEGDQRLTVDKGGKNAEFATRTGLFVTGNPENGRFDRNQPLPQQIDVDDSLISRFDGIVLIPDRQDEEHDENVAGHILDANQEASRDDVEEDVLDAPIPTEVMRAWVAKGRELNPTLTDEAKAEIRDYYVELRNRNDDDDTFVATARKVESMIRFAQAFARLHLTEDVTQREAELATTLMDKIVGQNYDPQSDEWVGDMMTEADSEGSIRVQLKEALDFDTWMFPDEIARETNLSESKVRDALNRAKQGKLSLNVEEKNGKWRLQ